MHDGRQVLQITVSMLRRVEASAAQMHFKRRQNLYLTDMQDKATTGKAIN